MPLPMLTPALSILIDCCPRLAGGASSVATRPARRTTRGHKHGRAASESADEERVPSPTLRKKRSRCAGALLGAASSAVLWT